MMVLVDKARRLICRDQREALAGALELVQGGGDQPGAGAAHRMPQRDVCCWTLTRSMSGLVHPRPGQQIHGRERLR